MNASPYLANQTVQKNENKIISGLQGQIPSSMASFPVTNAMKHMVPIEHKIRLPSLQKHPSTKLYENQERKVTEVRSPVIEHHAYVNLFGNKKWEETNLGENGVHGTIWGQGYVSM